MASVSNRPFAQAEYRQINTVNVTATTLTGSSIVSGSSILGASGKFTAATYSSSAIYMKGCQILEGFKVTGSVSAGDILVVSDTSADYLSGSKQNLPTTVVGVAAEAASNDTAVKVITQGVVTLYQSGSTNIGLGELVGAALSGSNSQYIVAATAVGTILGKALNAGTAHLDPIKVLLISG